MSLGAINEYFTRKIQPLLESLDSKLTIIIGLLAAGGDNTILATGTTGAIPANTETTIVTYTNSSGSAQRANFLIASGDYSTCYKVKINGDEQALSISPTIRNLLLGPQLALLIPNGSTLLITAEHESGSTQTFTGAIIGR